MQLRREKKVKTFQRYFHHRFTEMSQQYKPENVLRRAEDLLALQQPEKALDHLHQFIVHKKTRTLDHSNTQLIDVLRLFIDIAVQRRDFHSIKDALHQFKKGAVTTSNGIEALEIVVKYLLTTANSKLAQAQTDATDAAELANEQSHADAMEAKRAFRKTAGDDEDDEDEEVEIVDDELAVGDDDMFAVSPETMLLSAVSTDNAAERSNKEFFLPWLKFIWEAYRTVIDLLKNNNQLEVPYCYVVGEVFKFCEQYQRYQEFKKFCEILRTHLLAVVKPGYTPPIENADAVNISKGDSLQRLLETRFLQLNTAVNLELWKESFKSVEDVQHLMKFSKRSPRPVSLVTYYTNLAKIFQISENLLFDAAARLKLFNLLLQNPNVKESDLKETASLQLIASLVIPLQANGTNQDVSIFASTDIIDFDFFNRKNNKLASLLNLKEIPKKEALLNSPIIFKYADNELIKLYKLIESSPVNPLTLKTEIDSILTNLSTNALYAPYLEDLKTIVIQKVVIQLASVYETINLDFILRLISFDSAIFKIDDFQLEDLLLNIEQTKLLPNHYIEIDFELGVVMFIPKIENDQFTDLSEVMASLSQSIKLINTEEAALSQSELLAKLTKSANESFNGEIEELERRFVELKEREKQLKELKDKDNDELKKQRAEELEEEKRLEKQRLENDEVKREEERVRKQKERIQLAELKKLVAEVNENGVIKLSMEEAKKMTTNEIKKMQIDQLEQDRKAMMDKLDSTAKRVDYLERAQREAELPLLKIEADKVLDIQKNEYEEMKVALIEKSKKEYAANVSIKNRLTKFVEDYNEIIAATKNAAYEQYQKDKVESQVKLEEAKKARIAEFIASKKAEFEAAQERERAQAEAESKAAEAAQAREELLRAREEAAAKRAAAAAEEAQKKAEEAQKKPMSFAEKMRLKKAGLL